VLLIPASPASQVSEDIHEQVDMPGAEDDGIMEFL
jgi:hypothetical protein